MAGQRTALVLAIAATAVAVTAQEPQQPFHLDLVAATSGLRVQRYEVTIGEWKECFDAKACSHMPKRTNAASGAYPVTGINWFDASEYVAWARARSGVALRMPTRDEWYAMSGIVPEPRRRLFTDPRLSWAADYGGDKAIDPTLRPSGGFGATVHGIADVKGNVWEWTATCASAGFEGADAHHCPAYKAAGEHEANVSVFVRDPAQGGCAAGVPPAHLGLRLVAD